jgi:glycosyltransferase involved in cell wall biosynthesis
LRVTHLSTFDISGGAARSAYRLHAGLLGIGLDSRMVTLFKESTDPRVARFDPPRDLLARMRRGLRRRYLERTGKEARSWAAESGYFSDDRSQHGADVLRQLPQTDVLNLHWVANFIDYRLFFREVSGALPIVWTLHDMNSLTGGCHHAADCEKFQGSCGMCPQLGSSIENDLSRKIWGRKRETYDSISTGRFAFVTPSRWLAGRVKESSLGRGFRVEVIPNGLDTKIFKPRERRAAREALGLAPDATYILFASYFSKDSYKGFPKLLEALHRIQIIPGLSGLTVGLGDSEPTRRSPIPIQSLGFIGSEEHMSLVYCAADIFVLPSAQDNFPNTALEALACGIPTVAFHVGGIPEIVRNGQTGLTVSPGDSAALARAMDELLAGGERRAAMSSECRRVALEEYSLEVQASRYCELYEELRARASAIGRVGS